MRGSCTGGFRRPKAWNRPHPTCARRWPIGATPSDRGVWSPIGRRAGPGADGPSGPTFRLPPACGPHRRTTSPPAWRSPRATGFPCTRSAGVAIGGSGRGRRRLPMRRSSTFGTWTRFPPSMSATVWSMSSRALPSPGWPSFWTGGRATISCRKSAVPSPPACLPTRSTAVTG